MRCSDAARDGDRMGNDKDETYPREDHCDCSVAVRLTVAQVGSAMHDESPRQEPTERPYSGNLNPSEAATAMQAARLNALELLDTAEILHDLKRFAHSVAFSTLAIEEAGKVPLLMMICLKRGELPVLWRAYRRHQEKTRTLNVGIEARVLASFPGASPEEAREIGDSGPTPKELETWKQRAIYSDCLETVDGFVSHLPRNLMAWRRQAWERLCEARALIYALRDFPPEELEVWMKHASQAPNELDFPSLLRFVHDDLLGKRLIKKGQWASLFKFLQQYEDNDKKET